MYDFRMLNADYVMEVSVLQEGNVKSQLQAEYSVEARYINIEERYLFTIKRKNIALKESRSPVDGLMQELGDALFPIELYVSTEARIEGVKNFPEIKERWENVATNTLEKAYSLPTDNYISLARRNMENEKSFLESFSRQTFIQLFFRDSFDLFFTYSTCNLSGRETAESMICEKREESEGIVIFENLAEEGNSSLFEYGFSNTGEVCSVDGTIGLVDAEQCEVFKHISLRVSSRQVKKSNKLISFLID